MIQATQDPHLDAASCHEQWTLAVNARDFSALRSLAHPEFEMRPIAHPRSGPYHGVDGLRAWLHDTRGRPSVRTGGRVVESSEDLVLLEGTLCGSDHRGPLPDQDVRWALTLRDGRVVCDETFAIAEDQPLAGHP